MPCSSSRGSSLPAAKSSNVALPTCRSGITRDIQCGINPGRECGKTYVGVTGNGCAQVPDVPALADCDAKADAV